PSFDEFEGTRELFDLQDEEFGIEFGHKRDVGADTELEFSVDWKDKNRNIDIAVSEVDTDEEGAPLPPYVEFDRLGTRISEQRLDPYVMLSGDAGAMSWETGLRYEHTEFDIRADGERFDNDFSMLLP